MSAPDRPRGSRRRRLGLLVAALAAAAMACGGPASYEIPIETPIQPKLDVTPFQRVLIAGFVAGGTDEVDTNQETVRLLRSQLRSKSSLRVIDADTMPLLEVAQEQSRVAGGDLVDATLARAGGAGAQTGSERTPQALALPPKIRDEKDLEPYERLFANSSYWKQIGEEYQKIGRAHV